MDKAQKNTWAKKMAQLRHKQEEQEALEELKKEVITKWSPYTVEVEVAAQREKEKITRSEKKCREDKIRLHQEWTKRHPEVIAIDSKQMIESDSDKHKSPKRKGKSAHYYHTTRLAAWRATRFKSATGTRAKTKGPSGEQQLQGLSYASFVNNVATLRAKGDNNVAEVQHGGIYRPGGMPLIIPYENKPLKPAERAPLYEKPPNKEPEPAAEEPPPKKKTKFSHAKSTFANGRDKLPVPRSAMDGASLTSLSSVCSWCSLQARKTVPPTWIDPNILKAPRTINCIWRKPVDKAIQTDPILVPTSKAASREARAEDNWRFLHGVSTSDIVVGRRDSGDSEAKQSRECPTDPEVPVESALSGSIRDWITSSLADEEIDPLQNLPCDGEAEEGANRDGSTWLPPEDREMFLKLQSDECAEMESDLNVIPTASTHDFEEETPRRMTIALYTYDDFQEVLEKEAQLQEQQPVIALPATEIFPEDIGTLAEGVQPPEEMPEEEEPAEAKPGEEVPATVQPAKGVSHEVKSEEEVSTEVQPHEMDYEEELESDEPTTAEEKVKPKKVVRRKKKKNQMREPSNIEESEEEEEGDELARQAKVVRRKKRKNVSKRETSVQTEPEETLTDEMLAEQAPTEDAPAEEVPTEAPTEEVPTEAPTDEVPTEAPTEEVTTEAPSEEVQTEVPSEVPTEQAQTEVPTEHEEAPTEVPTEREEAPTEEVPTEHKEAHEEAPPVQEPAEEPVIVTQTDVVAIKLMFEFMEFQYEVPAEAPPEEAEETEEAEEDETDQETLVELFVLVEEDTLEERQLAEGEAQEETPEGERPPDEQGPAEMTAVEPFTIEEEIGEGPCAPG